MNTSYCIVASGAASNCIGCMDPGNALLASGKKDAVKASFRIMMHWIYATIAIDRSVCPYPCGMMHTRCAECGFAIDACSWEVS